jgi:hypothetical protein
MLVALFLGRRFPEKQRFAELLVLLNSFTVNMFRSVD